MQKVKTTRERFYEKQFSPIKDLYPRLIPTQNADNWTLEGEIDIIDEFGEHWDCYNVKISFPLNYPDSIPTMFETGGKIEKKAEFHVNPDGSCCVSVPAKEHIILKQGITIKSYLEELAIPYLANQTYKRITGDYANGEFDHGVIGIYEFYSEHFETKRFTDIIDILIKVASNTLPRRNDNCFCGSGIKYKNCHQKSIGELSVVPRTIIINDCQQLHNAIKAIMNSKKDT